MTSALGCTIPVTETATALVAALVAVLGTLTAKHRPAGARTRSSDREPRDLTQPPLDDWGVEWDELGDDLVADELPPRPRSRLARAAAELRTPHRLG